MRLVPVVERLKQAGIRPVYGALEFAGLKATPAQLPAYFVVPEGWDARPNDRSGVHDQARADTFMVVLMLRSTTLRPEAEVADDVQREEQRVVDALVAWTHPDASRACEAVRGRLVSVDGHQLSWAVTFRSGSHIRKALA